MKSIIFVVEDDDALQELYEYSLDNEFKCRCFSHGQLLFDALENDSPDLIILDIMLPGEYDGFTILSRLKEEKKTSHIPVIMVSAKGEEVSKVRGLNMGADDYISKPFGVLELVARVKANLRKCIKQEVNSIVYKDIVIDLMRRSISINNNPIKTTLKEYNLLYFLCKNPEKVHEREVIFAQVWGDDFIGETRTLDIHIKELRKKLAEVHSGAVIQTVRGVGYMIV